MQHEHGHHDEVAGQGGGFLYSFSDALHDTEGLANLLVWAIAAAVVIGVGLAVYGAMRRRTALSVIGVASLWAAPCAAYLALAKLGDHAFYKLMRNTEPMAALGMGCIGLLLLIHLAPAPLQRKHLIAAGTGAIMAVTAAMLILSGWGDIRALTGVPTGMLWGSATLAAILSICMLYHLLHGDYALDRSVRRFIMVAFPVLSLYALGSGYVIYREVSNDQHLRLHVQILRIEQAIRDKNRLLDDYKRDLANDTRELQSLRSAGINDSDVRVRTLVSDTGKTQAEMSLLNSFIPKLESAKWVAQRMEQNFHRLSREDSLLALEIVASIADASTDASNRDIDAILDKGLNGLNSFADKSNPR